MGEAPQIIERLEKAGIDFERLAWVYNELAGQGVREELTDGYMVSEIAYLTSASQGDTFGLGRDSAAEEAVIAHVRTVAGGQA